MHNCNAQQSEGRVGLQNISALFVLAANSVEGPLLLSSRGKGALVLVRQTKPKKKRFRALDKLVLNGQTDRKTHFDILRSWQSQKIFRSSFFCVFQYLHPCEIYKQAFYITDECCYSVPHSLAYTVFVVNIIHERMTWCLAVEIVIIVIGEVALTTGGRGAAAWGTIGEPKEREIVKNILKILSFLLYLKLFPKPLACCRVWLNISYFLMSLSETDLQYKKIY